MIGRLVAMFITIFCLVCAVSWQKSNITPTRKTIAWLSCIVMPLITWLVVLKVL